jgi:hypothetical protein
MSPLRPQILDLECHVFELTNELQTRTQGGYMPRLTILIAVILATATAAQATVIHVPSDQPTIQAGIDAGQGGDTVMVAPGSYTENINFHGKRLVLVSTGGALATVIQAASNSTAVVSIVAAEPKGTVLQGFTITGGGSSGGAVMCVGSAPTIQYNHITGNLGGDNVAAGVSLKNTIGAVVRGNVIYHNSGGYGCAIHVGDDGITCSNDTICGNVLYDNVGTGDIRCLGTMSNLQIFDNTIRCVTYAGVFVQSQGTVVARNNIVFDSPGQTGSCLHPTIARLPMERITKA